MAWRTQTENFYYNERADGDMDRDACRGRQQQRGRSGEVQDGKYTMVIGTAKSVFKKRT